MAEVVPRVTDFYAPMELCLTKKNLSATIGTTLIVPHKLNSGNLMPILIIIHMFIMKKNLTHMILIMPMILIIPNLTRIILPRILDLVQDTLDLMRSSNAKPIHRMCKCTPASRCTACSNQQPVAHSESESVRVTLVLLGELGKRER